MEKIFKITNVECGHCTAEVEAKTKKLEGVENASYNFFVEKLIVNFKENVDVEALVSQIKKIITQEAPTAVVKVK